MICWNQQCFTQPNKRWNLLATMMSFGQPFFVAKPSSGTHEPARKGRPHSHISTAISVFSGKMGGWIWVCLRIAHAEIDVWSSVSLFEWPWIEGKSTTFWTYLRFEDSTTLKTKKEQKKRISQHWLPTLAINSHNFVGSWTALWTDTKVHWAPVFRHVIAMNMALDGGNVPRRIV